MSPDPVERRQGSDEIPYWVDKNLMPAANFIVNDFNRKPLLSRRVRLKFFIRNRILRMDRER